MGKAVRRAGLGAAFAAAVTAATWGCCLLVLRYASDEMLEAVL